jgi:hypothetical protein
MPRWVIAVSHMQAPSNNRSKGRDAQGLSAAGAERQCAHAALIVRLCAALQLHR